MVLELSFHSKRKGLVFSTKWLDEKGYVSEIDPETGYMKPYYLLFKDAVATNWEPLSFPDL